ncbi:hypothetical protein A359_08140 [secondary endosymbiont of Ctenarytaina eucalypti]|uniref:Uncharacterized protein n=1 Tax=secondary endosymbiont of Ctenarytaina eucalypti TaxID=1199245 RepID=J3TXZ5_9ENTR|nr:hypothetical protein A359_08140 [secondary endosymbiont of Ctenarytaina eucalypti]
MNRLSSANDNQMFYFIVQIDPNVGRAIVTQSTDDSKVLSIQDKPLKYFYISCVGNLAPQIYGQYLIYIDLIVFCYIPFLWKADRATRSIFLQNKGKKHSSLSYVVLIQICFILSVQ